MSIDPTADADHPAWWDVHVDQLGLPLTTIMMLRLIGILHCQDFCDWSRAELGSWATEHSVNPVPFMITLARDGIPLAPNDRPDRLVRLVLAPASHASRQAAIEYYGLLGHQPRTLQGLGAEDPSQHRLLARRLAAARPRLATLQRVAPQLALTLSEAGARGEREPMQLARSIAPLLGEGETPPENFARLLLDVLTPTLGAPAAPPKPRTARKQRPSWSELLSQVAGESSDAIPKRDKAVHRSATLKPATQAMTPVGQRSERKRAAADLIDLLFNEDDT